MFLSRNFFFVVVEEKLTFFSRAVPAHAKLQITAVIIDLTDITPLRWITLSLLYSDFTLFVGQITINISDKLR